MLPLESSWIVNHMKQLNEESVMKNCDPDTGPLTFSVKSDDIIRSSGGGERTLILPLRTAGPSSASRRTNRSILYSRPPRMLKPKPLTLFSSSTVKKSKSCVS